MHLRLTTLIAALVALIALAASASDGAPALAGGVPCDVGANPGNAQQKIDSAQPGTVICLAQGDYDRLFVYQKSNLMITGAGIDRTTVNDGPQNHTCLLVVESRDVWLDNMTAYDCRVQGAYAGDSTNIIFSRIETVRGPIGFQYRNSSGKISDSRAHDHHSSSGAAMGATAQYGANVTISDSTFDHNDGFGVLAQYGSTLRLIDSRVEANSDGGVFTVKSTGNTTIIDSVILNNKLNVFAGMPGCAGLPVGSSAPPSCYVANPNAYRSNINITISDSTIHNAYGTGIVFFPGVDATLRRNLVQYNAVTGLFAWGAHVNSRHDRFSRNTENNVECRAYPDPSSGDRGLCDFRYDTFDRARPLPGNSLGGGFVCEGARIALKDSVAEYNWGIGFMALHNCAGELSYDMARDNGGSGYCYSGVPGLSHHHNGRSGNRSGDCLGHP